MLITLLSLCGNSLQAYLGVERDGDMFSKKRTAFIAATSGEVKCIRQIIKQQEGTF